MTRKFINKQKIVYNIHDLLCRSRRRRLELRERNRRQVITVSVTSPKRITNRKRDIPRDTDPSNHLKEILFQLTGKSIHPHAALELKNFFLEVTAEHVSAYTHDVISAVREQDIDVLREMHQDGRILQCSNRFGESILHMACRRGAVKVVRFLLEEAKVCFKVKDDYGRTPLHDAFWATNPEKDIVKMLLNNCPDLLLVSDRRGFTPLSYVRKEHWDIWCKFLEDNRGIIQPKELL